MDDDTVRCVVCKKQEPDANKLITCMYCFSTAYFKCRNIIGSAISRVKANMYFCTTNCSEIYKRIAEMQNSSSSMMSMLASELKETVASVVANQMSHVQSEVRSVTTAIEKSQEFLSAKFDEIASDFNKLKIENETLKKQISELSKSQNELTNYVQRLEANVDRSDRKAVSNNVVLLGLPNQVNENTMKLVDKTFAHIGVTLPPDSILSAKRLYASNKANGSIPIQIVFKDSNSKETVLARKKW